MFRKAAVLGMAYYALVIILAGCCNCPAPLMHSIRWTGLRLGSGQYEVLPDSTLRTGSDSTTDFRRLGYVLQLNPQYEVIAAGRPFRAGLVSTAYACKCSPEDRFSSEQNISGVRIFSLQDFDSLRPAGSEITDCFGSLQNINGRVTGFGPPQTSYIARYDGRPHEIGYLLFLVRRPTAGSRQQFRVDMIFSDSSSYSAETAVLQF